MIIGFLIVLVASFFLGTFGLGMKYNKPLAWEAFWGVHAVTGMIVIPTTIGLLAIPDVWQAIGQDPGLVESAKQEIMRLWPRSIFASRTALWDTEFRGAALQSGRHRLVLHCLEGIRNDIGEKSPEQANCAETRRTCPFAAPGQGNYPLTRIL
jgi:hypothetical protein